MIKLKRIDLPSGLRSAVGNVSDCRSRSHKFDPGPVPYFRVDGS